MPPNEATPIPGDSELLYLRSLARQYPTLPAAVCEIARLRSALTLPKGTVHVLSDIHGEAKKLKHVIHNASGSLRPTLEELFRDKLDSRQRRDLLTLLYYPREAFARLREELVDGERLKDEFRHRVDLAFELMRYVARRSTVRQIDRTFPEEYRELFHELFFERPETLETRYLDALLDTLVDYDLALDFLQQVSRTIRNLTVRELIVAGDCGDRGPRIDRVIDSILRQPSVAFTWGNHDVTWLGACLGHDLMIATVLRISLRYRRLSQLEEGYGIILSPLEKLVRDCYSEDPAEIFLPKGHGLRETVTMARMQKAISMIQFKLEGRAIARNPDWQMQHRDLMSRVDWNRGTLGVDGLVHPLRDKLFPTVDPADPLALSPEEEACMSRIRQSFLASDKLWRHMLFLKKKGRMYVVRDRTLIFHGCLAVDERGEFLPLSIDGRPYQGRPMMDKLDSVIQRCFRDRSDPDLDLLWYLWAGANSPLFGKDRMATFERALLEDASTHKETKNAYFKLIHEGWFCEKVLAEFGVDPAEGMVVNGHVPVKIEQGEDPVKKSRKAITIDGAFSEAYGDHGYTLILDSQGINLARHSHFESVEEAVANGTDIIPEVTCIRRYEQERLVWDTEEGEEIRQRIQMLERLVVAYRENLISETS